MEPRRRFRFLKELSEGSFGKVYLAEMVTGEGFSTVVAIKLLHGKWLGHEEIVQRSRDEARLLGLLRHRNIIRVEDLTSINGQCAIIMEYLEGVDLKTLSAVLKEKGERFPFRAVFEVVAAIASALDAAYNHVPLRGGGPLRVIHRDIKPSNVMLTAAGEVKVLDFGTARANFEEREARTQALAFGSQAYMAPERQLDEQDTPAADIYSLGIVTYELLTLERFGRVSIRRERFEQQVRERLEKLDFEGLDPGLAEQVRALLRGMLSYNLEDRPTAAQVVEVMEDSAERAGDMSLRRFSRRVVPEAMALSEPYQNPADPLTGSTVFEDSISAFDGFSSDSGSWLVENPPAAPTDVPQPAHLRESRPAAPRPPEPKGPAEAPGPPPSGPVGEERPLPPPTEELPPVDEAPRAGPAGEDSGGRAREEQAPSSGVPATSELSTLPEGPAAEHEPAPPPTSPPAERARGRYWWGLAVLLVLGLAGGGALLARGRSSEPAQQGTAAASPASGEPQRRVTPPESSPLRAPGAENTGVLELELEEPGSAWVTIISTLGGRHEWDGRGRLRLDQLPAGSYRTKIRPRGGRSYWSTVTVRPGMTCSYALAPGEGREWKELSCD